MVFLVVRRRWLSMGDRILFVYCVLLPLILTFSPWEKGCVLFVVF